MTAPDLGFERRKLSRREMAILMRDPCFIKWASELNDRADEAVKRGKYADGKQKLLAAPAPR
jgi:hypothetical protein